MKAFYTFFEKGFLKHLHKKGGKKLGLDNLTYSFADISGNLYYKFPRDTGLPMCRLGKLHEYIKWLSAGVTGDELERLITTCENEIQNCIKTSKGWAKIGWALSEIKDRKKMIVNDELFYNIIAVQIIRHDESPTVFNNEIQLQKVAEFRKLNETNDTFFLNISEYLTALNWSNITNEELVSMLTGSMNHRKATAEMMQKLFENLSNAQKATLNSL